MKFRKMTAVLAACILAVSANIGLPETAYSGTSLQAAADATATGTYGNLTYVSTGSAITITQCDANATYEVIPEEIDGLPVTKIDSNAFENCSKLVGVIVPESVKNIGLYAFSGCTALSDVTLPESVTAISAHMFAGCTALESLMLPSGTLSIGYNAFDGCTALSDITLPDTVQTIGSAAFTGCTSLTEMAIPDAVLSVGDSAFEGCTALETVKLGSAIKVLGGLAFADCSALTAINIPASVTTIGDGVFRNSLAMTSLTVNGGNTKYKAMENVLFSADMTQLIAYPAGLLEYCYTVPKTVTDIHNYAFYGNLHLTEITFPNTLATIGANAFYSDEGVTNIGRIYFYNSMEIDTTTHSKYLSLCRTAEIYENPEMCVLYELNYNDYYMACYCSDPYNTSSWRCDSDIERDSSGNYIFTDGYTVFGYDENGEGQYSFELSGIEALDVIVPHFVFMDSAGNDVLFGFNHSFESSQDYFCKAVNPRIDDDLYYLGYYGSTPGALRDYGQNYITVKTVEKAYDIENLADYVEVAENNVFGDDIHLFRYSEGLITTPNETDALTSDAFTYHQYDSSVGISGYDTSQTTAVLPDKIDRLPVTAIEDMAFYRCNDLQSVTISDNVATIGEYAFYFNSELETVVIPYSVSSIEGSAFAGCTDLKDVYYNGSEEEWAAITVGGMNECLLNATIHFNSTGPEPTTEPETYTLGDVNLDDKVSVADVISVNKFYMKTGDLNELQQTAGDCNHDGSVDLSDSLLILKSLIGLVTLT